MVIFVHCLYGERCPLSLYCHKTDFAGTALRQPRRIRMIEVGVEGGSRGRCCLKEQVLYILRLVGLEHGDLLVKEFYDGLHLGMCARHYNCHNRLFIFHVIIVPGSGILAHLVFCSPLDLHFLHPCLFALFGCTNHFHESLMSCPLFRCKCHCFHNARIVLFLRLQR